MGKTLIGVCLTLALAACADDDTQGKSDVADTTSAPRVQCQPCRADPGCPDGARCLDYLGQGAFCGDECSDTLPCSSGFLCAAVDTLAGQSIRACVHDSGLCPCTPEVAARAEPTVCVTPSDWGSCRGESLCDGAAWSACDGPVAMPDVPNGLDDDCDGQTDENLCNCGDDNCNQTCGETLESCPCDCAVKGDGVCSPCGEGPLTAPEDCCRSTTGSSSCGDHVCMGFGCGETPATCPEDCGNACGNLVCDQGESPYSCAEDCLHKVCGNHICESTDGGPEACPQDCAPFCGNCICEPSRDESQFNCPIDCGYCGDRECSRCAALKENAASCEADCCEPGATCVVAGSCNIGRYACEDGDSCELTGELWPRGVECGPRTCDGDALRLESRCDDEGACQPGVLFPCQGFVCRGDACLESCGGPSDCAPGFTCLGTVCAPLVDDEPRVNGQGCDDETQCVSEHCIDERCCDAACAGPCVSCAVPGHEGACWPLPAGDDDEGQCSGDALCVGGMLVAGFACDGAGDCKSDGATPCPNNLGCTADGRACRSNCTSEADCIAGYVCEAGTCTPGRDPGETCDSGAQCLGGHCEDGVCCASACVALCKSCNVEGAEGTCTLVPRGDDPGEQCAGDIGAPCGLTGACDGAGACELGAAGSGCGGGVCNDDVVTPPWKCDGLGDCVEAATGACPGHLVCNAGNTACLSQCDRDGDCVDGYYCDIDKHLCELLGPPGDDCTFDWQCADGHCEDGVCCSDVCETECMSCRVPGHEGTCWMVPVATDPDEECEPIAGDVCGPTGLCDGAGRCAEQLAGMTCAPPGCHDGFMATAFFCDGYGGCTGASPIACPGHLDCRDDTACLVSCAFDGDCVGGWVCNEATGQCADPGQTGSPCDGNGDCASDHCAEQVCCAPDCYDVCERCSATGACQQLHQVEVAGCMNDSWCLLGQCRSKLLQDGAPCIADTQCQSGACSDGFCCNEDCDGVVCKECGLFGREGTCSLVVGEEEDCTGSVVHSPCVDIDGNCTRVCDELGVCVEDKNETAALCTLDSQCPPDQWCGMGGFCDDDGASGASCMRNAACLSNLCLMPSFTCF